MIPSRWEHEAGHWVGRWEAHRADCMACTLMLKDRWMWCLWVMNISQNTFTSAIRKKKADIAAQHLCNQSGRFCAQWRKSSVTAPSPGLSLNAPLHFHCINRFLNSHDATNHCHHCKLLCEPALFSVSAVESWRLFPHWAFGGLRSCLPVVNNIPYYSKYMLHKVNVQCRGKYGVW